MDSKTKWCVVGYVFIKKMKMMTPRDKYRVRIHQRYLGSNPSHSIHLPHDLYTSQLLSPS